MKLRIHSALLFGACFATFAAAATRTVDSVASLQTAIHAAAPGDTIVLRNGVYTTTNWISVRRAGTAEAPITITAETVGGVELAGSHGFNLVEPAAHIVISGFVLTHAAGRNTIGPGTSHVRVTRNTFQCAGEGAYLTVAGDDVQIDHNEFRDKQSGGSMLAVAGTGRQVARRLWVHHNHFRDLTGLGTSGSEMIRFGLTQLSLSTGAGLVEHNLFERCRGESELISSRASGITYRYNTFADSPTAQFTLRHGHDCEIYGNVFRNTEGLRIFGDRHRVSSNYFEKNYIGLNLGNGSAEVADGGAPSSHDRPDGCILVFNTFVDNRTHYQMSRRPGQAFGATRTTFAHNLLQGGSVAAKIEGPYVDAVWSGNVLWNVAHPGDFPTDSFVEIDPLLSPAADGLHRPAPGSPVFAAAKDAFPEVSVDLRGRPRPATRSIGAEEPDEGPLPARLLTAENVGPHAHAEPEQPVASLPPPAESPPPQSPDGPARTEGADAAPPTFAPDAPATGAPSAAALATTPEAPPGAELPR